MSEPVSEESTVQTAMPAQQLNTARPAGAPFPLGEAATFLGVSARTLVRLGEAGKLKLIRLGTGRGRVLVPAAEVERLANQGV
jgi:excisionase family DNA binding protein